MTSGTTAVPISLTPAGGHFDAEMTPEEKKTRDTGVCCFSMLGLVSTAAFICGVVSYSRCDFVSRYVTLGPDYAAGGYASACEGLGYDDVDDADSQVCRSLLQNHGIGFTYWQATIPVDQTLCFSYTQFTPWGYVTPAFDSAFVASRWFSIIGYVFGGGACFTLLCSSCCRMDQKRLMCIAWYFLIACFFQGMSLLVFTSNVCKVGFFAPYFIPPSQRSNQTYLDEYQSIVAGAGCSLSLGSKMAISATVLYFICALMVPYSIVPFYQERSYHSEYSSHQQRQQQQQQEGLQAEQARKPEDPSPSEGQEPVVEGQVTGNV